MVAALAVLVVVGAVALALSVANAPTPSPPTLGPVSTLSASALTATEAAAATANADEHRLAVTLAAVMQVTPGAVARGISLSGAAQAPAAADFVAQNVWVGLVDGGWISVYAGALRSEPQQGALLLVTVAAGRVDQEQFVTPLSQGALHVSAQNVQRLTLVSASGATFLFDVLARRFVGTLTEFAATATPRGATSTALASATPSATSTLSVTPTVTLTATTGP